MFVDYIQLIVCMKYKVSQDYLVGSVWVKIRLVYSIVEDTYHPQMFVFQMKSEAWISLLSSHYTVDVYMCVYLWDGCIMVFHQLIDMDPGKADSVESVSKMYSYIDYVFTISDCLLIANPCFFLQPIYIYE